MKSFEQIKQQYDQNLLPTYGRQQVAFTRGEGAKLYDTEGKEYIDFASGIGVNSIGHSHPAWVAAVTAQAGSLAHTSNLFYTTPGGALAEKICALSGMGGVFFANSGAEANEGIIKAARKYSHDKYGKNRATILTLVDSFHGRTITTLAANGQDKFHQHFFPFTEGFRHVAAGDTTALNNQPDDVCALLIEVVQGEGGVNPLDSAYVQAAAEICKKRDWLLLVDEVQTGIGRTGKWFGFQHFGIQPDGISFAKGIGGGLPLGGFALSKELAKVLNPGDHGSTYGGNLIACAAALAVLEVLEKEIEGVEKKGEYIRRKITEMNLAQVEEVRGLGLMLGLKLNINPGEVNAKLLSAGLVALTAGTDVLRFLPPLTINYEDIDAGLKILESGMKS